MAKTIEQLKAQSAEVKNASVIGENTATRVGSLFNDIVEHVEAYEAGQAQKDTDQSTSINAETSRATAAETTLSERINQEVAERKAMDETIGVQLSNEIERAKGMELGISTKLNDEIARATEAENNLQEQITSEAEARDLAINTETQARSQNDQLLSQAIAAEQERAEAAEHENATKINAAVTKNEEQDQKLSELEQKVDDTLFLETAIDSTGTRTGYLNSSESYVADADYEILSFPVPQGGKIHVFGKIDKSCRAIFSNQPAAIVADAFLENIWINSLNEETDIDVEVEVPEYTGQVYARVSRKKTLPMSVTLIDSINRIEKLEQKVDDIEDVVTPLDQSIDVISEKTEQLFDLIQQLNFNKLDDFLATKQSGRYLKSPTFYVADSNYSIYFMPIDEGDVIHLKGSNDVINAINFQGDVGIGEQVISTIATFSDESLHDIDMYATAPAGSRYIVYSVKNNLALNCYKAARIDVDALNSIIYGEKRSIIYPVSASTRMNAFFNDERVKKGAKILFSMTTENQDAIGKLFYIYVHNNDSYTHVKSVKMPCSDVELIIPTLTSNYLLIQSASALSTSASSVEVTLVFKQGVDERLKNLESETSYIYVAPNGNDETGDGTIANPYATIFHANEMITDNSEKHRYIIKVADGTYTDLQVRYAGVSSSTYQGVVSKNFVTYEGNVLHPENVILKWDGSTGYSEPYDYDTMFFTKCLFHVSSEVETTIKGFTFDAKNTRYALHIETSGAGMGSKWEVSDCIFNWHGVPSRTNTPAIGTGSGFFEKGHLLRCKINNDIANIDGWRNHDSNYPSSYDANRFKEGAEIVIESCDFGNSSILWRTLSTSNSYNGYNRCVIKNCIGIKTLSHLEASGVSNSWRARVECSDIETNNFSENEMYY